MSAVPHPLRERGIDLLASLVGFPSLSLSPNGDIVGYIEGWLLSLIHISEPTRPY